MAIGEVYGICNKINDRVYVGATIKGRRRWTGNHRPALRRGIHSNNYLQNAWNKYGEENFEFVILESVNRTRLLAMREQYWMDHHRGLGGIYNLGNAADSPMRGRCHTEETKAKMSLAHMGNKSNLGHKHTEETKAKMRFAKIGNKNALGNKNLLGYKHTEEAKARMSKSAKLAWRRRKRERSLPISEKSTINEAILAV